MSAAAIAEDAPLIGGVMAGPDSTIWVQDAARSGAELLDLQRPGGRVWRVFDTQGRPAGTATFPLGVQPIEWRGDRLAAIARDGLGRTSAVAYHVERPR